MFKSTKVFDPEILSPGDLLLVREKARYPDNTTTEDVTLEQYIAATDAPETLMLLVIEVDDFKIQVVSADIQDPHAGIYEYPISVQDIDDNYDFVYHLNPDMLLELLIWKGDQKDG